MRAGCWTSLASFYNLRCESKLLMDLPLPSLALREEEIAANNLYMRLVEAKIRIFVSGLELNDIPSAVRMPARNPTLFAMPWPVILFLKNSITPEAC
ncbi:hypothetical protein IP76_10515 [Rhizobium sp. AAP43]|nr:hypothetical protein IP76_10515 [Rhizobium sp. AAP43]